MSDNVSFGDLEVRDLTFIIVSKILDMKHFPASGLLGLGFNTLSDGVPTFLDHLKSENLIEDRSFSLYLTNYQSFIAIDGMD